MDKSSNFSLEEVLSKNSNLDFSREINVDGIIVTSDNHGNYSALENVYSIAKKNNSAVVINGDVTNDYQFQQFASELGYKTQQELFLEHAHSNLDEKNLQTLYFAQNYSQVQSLEPFLEQIPLEHKLEAKKTLESFLEYSKSDEFSQNFSNLVNSFKQEKEDEVIYNQTRLNILYHVFMDEEAKQLANLINYSGTYTIFNLGNHENALFVNQVRQYLDDPSKIIDATHHQGYITINQSNGQQMTLAGMTNCVQSMPYLQDVLASEQEYNFLTSHMGVDEIKSQTILQGDETQEKLNSLENLIKQDLDYKRIIRGEEKPLDIFLSHGQIGKVLTNNNKGFDVPYFGVAAYMSNLANLTIEGHIHSKYDGVNSFGNNMIRAAGEDAAIISKDEQGNLQKGWITIDEEFNGNHHNQIPYNKDYMSTRVEEIVKEIEEQNKLQQENQKAA